jgi:branched-chain amino acid transport system permease protein
VVNIPLDLVAEKAGEDKLNNFIHNLPQFLTNGLAMGCIYALVAMGFNIIYSSTGVINFAQGEFAMFGALLAYTFSDKFHVPILLAALLAIIGTALIGALMERLIIYPLRRAQVINVIIATIGASILFKALARVFWPEEAYMVPEFTRANMTFFGTSSWKMTMRSQLIWIFLITAVAVTITYFFFSRAREGKAMRACSINQQAASLVGINVSRMSLYAFLLAAALGGMAGLLSAGTASYNTGLYLGISGFTAAIIGGLGNTFGAVIGGLSLGIAEQLIVGFLSGAFSVSAGYRDAITAVFLVVMLLFRPQGILGGREKVRV